jgi:hypothetical protein
MKYFIAFLLLFLSPSFTPNTAFAAINSTHAVAHSAISPHKKLSFKQKWLLKLAKKDGEKLNKVQNFLLIGVLLLILGIILLVVGQQKSDAFAQKNPTAIFNKEGLGETVLGLASLGGALLFIALGIPTKKKTTKELP